MLPQNDLTFGLVGRKLGHSWSPQIHEMLGSAPYSLVELEPQEVEGFLRGGSWQGLNVTIPYKAVAAQVAGQTSERVRRLGVANTLVRRPDGTIFAENTDVLGFSWMLERFCRNSLCAEACEALRGAKALVLGSGGASQAVQMALRETSANVVVISRSGEERYETILERHADARLIVNATPVGMYPNCPATPIEPDVLQKMGDLAGVLDVVYNPERTGICLAAERLGIPSESGLAMLVSQAFWSSRLFQREALDDSLVETIEKDLRSRMRNIVLIGMPGVGKTTSGRQLARLLKRPFVDLDDAFELEVGSSPAEFIRSKGEASFRRRESEIAASYAERSGFVIACGGGIVTRPENYDLLHQNGTLVYLDRPIDALSTSGRPISQNRGVAELARERGPLYESWADLRLGCTGSPAGDAAAIASELGLTH